MSTADERYLEKIRARAEKRVPTFVTDPVVDLTSNTPEAIHARYLEKLKRHGKPAAEPEPKADTKPTKGGGKGAKAAEKPAAEPEPKAEPDKAPTAEPEAKPPSEASTRGSR